MLVLGLESSCDETSCAVVENYVHILSNKIASQEIHSYYGGVVPELASRCHLETFPKLLKSTLKEADISLNDLTAISVTSSPGLIGSLSVGVNFAKGLCTGLKLPLIGVNHVNAHLYAAFMNNPYAIQFPSLGIVVSGAHTSIFSVNSFSNIKLIGKTRDDAIGEVFDKVARLLNFPYPGGKYIEELAKTGNSEEYNFKGGIIKNSPYDLSFSGLKTAVLYAIKGKNSSMHPPFPELTEEKKRNLSASFQKAVFFSLVRKISYILKASSYKSILVGGGVASNKYFQNLLKTNFEYPVFFPKPQLCTDNAAMIAGLGSILFNSYNKKEKVEPCSCAFWENV